MKILGIETSCDETAAAVVANGTKILSNIVASQIDIHKEFGGVVPEVAARSHIEVILPVIERALKEAFSTRHPELAVPRLELFGVSESKIPDQVRNDKLWNQIDAIAVTRGPGLPGALLVGVITARTLALAKNKPLIGVDHVAAHTYANWLIDDAPQFPVLALIVSGGHSQLVLFNSHQRYRLLGQTLDDAVGEAFDKVAKMLGLGFPGGPAIALAALEGNATKYRFSEPRLDNPYDFSFSGIKTGVLRHLQGLLKKDYSFASHQIAPLLNAAQVNDTAASFQKTVVDWMVKRAAKAYSEFKPKTVVIAGGVAANQLLRAALAKAIPIKISYPPVNLCTDNAAMIASAAYFMTKNNQYADPLTLETSPSLAM